MCGNDKRSITHESGPIFKTFIHVHSVPSFEINGTANVLFSKKEPFDIGKKTGKQACEENKLLLYVRFSCIFCYSRSTVENLHQATEQFRRKGLLVSWELQDKIPLL